MLILLSVFELDSDSARHVIVFVVDRQLDLLLANAYLVVLLIVLQVEFDVDLDRPCQTSEER